MTGGKGCEEIRGGMVAREEGCALWEGRWVRRGRVAEDGWQRWESGEWVEGERKGV